VAARRGAPQSSPVYASSARILYSTERALNTPMPRPFMAFSALDLTGCDIVIFRNFTDSPSVVRWSLVSPSLVTAMRDVAELTHIISKEFVTNFLFAYSLVL